MRFFYFLSIGIISLSLCRIVNCTSLDKCSLVCHDQCKSHDIARLIFLVTVFLKRFGSLLVSPSDYLRKRWVLHWGFWSTHFHVLLFFVAAAWHVDIWQSWWSHCNRCWVQSTSCYLDIWSDSTSAEIHCVCLQGDRKTKETIITISNIWPFHCFFWVLHYASEGRSR